MDDGTSSASPTTTTMTTKAMATTSTAISSSAIQPPDSPAQHQRPSAQPAPLAVRHVEFRHLLHSTTILRASVHPFVSSFALVVEPSFLLSPFRLHQHHYPTLTLTFLLSTFSLSAWQPEDIAPTSAGGAISIPTQDTSMSNGGHEEQHWNNGSARSPGRGPGGEPPRRSSRSRSPGREDRGRGGGGGHNPGNNLHVSGLSTKVDTRDLEAAFAKNWYKKPRLCMTLTPASPVGLDLMGKAMNVERARRGRARTPTPGRYYGPPKRHERERFYDPRPYDSRYARDYDDDRRGGRGGRYEEAPPRRDYDRGYRDYDRGHGGGNRDYERRYEDRRY
ncbi:hypothetical protein EW146_g8743 [Bondarzewia mesenterica]|uniref:RRM domain-containing protein n=1 Tax=Bondarzewia mesenterica TaxID=1095465 RepID=A0A4S4LBS9_9AGAM|nr:hypothetical protein EW146_g8743 [Bondarzewia mesenterica]